MRRVALAVVIALAGQGALAQEAAVEQCPAAPEPVYSLAQGSRYADVGAGSTVIDPEADREVDETLAPIDDFLRDLTESANRVLGPLPDDADAGAARAALADCVVARMAVWADADALGNLASRSANLTLGARLAAFGLAAEQVAPFVTRPDDLARVAAWLTALQRGQMAFWETAPDGARRGNLRAWSALAASAIAPLTGDPVMLGWAAWSAAYVLCSAAPDGSLPQEMTRGCLALHYQLHAVAPLSVTVARLRAQGIDLADDCDAALRRAGEFLARDLADGAQSLAITGEVQSFFDGSDRIEGFNLAWIESFLTLYDSPALEALAAPLRPLGHSKLGGNQTALWRRD